MSLTFASLSPETQNRLIRKSLESSTKELLDALPKPLRPKPGQVLGVAQVRAYAAGAEPKQMQYGWLVVRCWAGRPSQKRALDKLRTYLTKAGCKPKSQLCFDATGHAFLPTTIGDAGDALPEAWFADLAPTHSQEELNLLLQLLGWVSAEAPISPLLPDTSKSGDGPAAEPATDAPTEARQEVTSIPSLSPTSPERKVYLSNSEEPTTHPTVEADSQSPVVHVAALLQLLDSCRELIAAGTLPDSLAPAVAQLDVLLTTYDTAYATALAELKNDSGTPAPPAPRPRTLTALYQVIEAADHARQARAQQHNVQKALAALRPLTCLTPVADPATTDADGLAELTELTKELTDFGARINHLLTAGLPPTESESLLAGTHWLTDVLGLVNGNKRWSELARARKAVLYDQLSRAMYLALEDAGVQVSFPASATDEPGEQARQLVQQPSPTVPSEVEAPLPAEAVITPEAGVIKESDSTPDVPATPYVAPEPTPTAGLEEETNSWSAPAEVDSTAPAALPHNAEKPVEPAPAGLFRTGGDAAPAMPPPTTHPLLADDSTEGHLPATPLYPIQWELLARGEGALAYQLAVYSAPTDATLPAWLLRALLLAPHLRATHGTLADELQLVSEQFTDSDLADAPGETPGSRRLLAWAAALGPALISPATGLPGWLSLGQGGVPDLGLTSLNHLVERVAQRRNQQPLDANLLTQVQRQQAWDSEQARLLKQLREWEKAQESERFHKSNGNDIVVFWRSLLPVGRLAGDLTQALRGSDTTLIRERLARLRDVLDGGKLPSEMQRSKLDYGKFVKNNKDAINWLGKRIASLAELTNAFLSNHDRLPRASAAQHEDNELVKLLHASCAKIQADLQSARDRETSPSAQASLTCCLHTVTRLEAWLRTPEVAPSEPLPYQVLNWPLLRLADLSLSPDWLPVAGAPTLKEALLALALPDGAPAWAALYAAAQYEASVGGISGPDHQATAHLLSLAAADGRFQLVPGGCDLGAPLEELRQRRQADLLYQQTRLLQRVELTDRALVRGQRYGYLDAAAQQRLRVTLTGLRLVAELRDQQTDDAAYNFRAHHASLSRFEMELEALRQQAITEHRPVVDVELDNLIVPASAEDRAKLARALDEGRLSLVDNYLAQLRAGRGLGPAAQALPPPIAATLPQRVRELGILRDQHDDGALYTALRQGGLLPTAGTPEFPAASAAVFNTWAELKAEQSLADGPMLDKLAELFNFLGFDEVMLTRPQPLKGVPRGQYLDLYTAPLRERRKCPVGRFGSEAVTLRGTEQKGHYRLVSCWNAITPADLHSVVKEHSRPDSAVLVMLWRPLSWARREELGVYCRSAGAGFLVLDELMLLYLASVGGRADRLGLFFQLLLPFAYLNPYTVSGKIPTELFYGREPELRRLVTHEADAAHIVYGGRQLGKTMLLRQAVRTSHHPKDKRFVVFADLIEVGRSIPVSDFGLFLVQELRARQLPDPDLTATLTKLGVRPTFEAVLNRLSAWVLAEEGRYLLLLLDEADKLLEADAAAEFPRVGALRRAMEQTHNRFKVVFSGLHDVQRTLDRPNQPLVQLGDPIRIGPLAPEEGADLIRTPLESLGFCFGETTAAGVYSPAEGLIDQIAVETNFYPSLLQIFGYRLLETLYDRQKTLAIGSSELLLRVSEQDVQVASQKARDEIRNRFFLTLDLNPRYRLFAYLIAEATAPGADEAGVSGLTVSTIRERARRFWPAGWVTRHDPAFVKALLDEMVLLGVLEQTGAADQIRYRLRTTNVRALLGTREEIEDELLRFEGEVPETDYLPSLVHAALPKPGTAPHFRGPLTVEELRTLENGAGVTLIYGLPAAGWAEVMPFLTARYQASQFADQGYKVVGYETVPEARFSELERTLERLIQAPPLTHHLVLVDIQAPLPDHFVRDTAALLRAGRFERRPVRVVFALAPGPLKPLLQRWPVEKLQELGIQLIALRPWDRFAVKDWLAKEMLMAQEWDRLTTLTGGWHNLLQRFHELGRRNANGAALPIEQLRDELANGRYAADWLPPEAPAYLSVLARGWHLEPFGIEDLVLAAEETGIHLPEANRAPELMWLEQLRLIQPRGADLFTLDPLVAQALRLRP